MSNYGGAATCTVCQKSVYPMEQVKADDLVFHKGCFKCTQCSSPLKLGNYAAIQGQYYCKPHYKQLFAQKGNYNFTDDDSVKSSSFDTRLSRPTSMADKPGSRPSSIVSNGSEKNAAGAMAVPKLETAKE